MSPLGTVFLTHIFELENAFEKSFCSLIVLLTPTICTVYLSSLSLLCLCSCVRFHFIKIIKIQFNIKGFDIYLKTCVSCCYNYSKQNKISDPGRKFTVIKIPYSWFTYLAIPATFSHIPWHSSAGGEDFVTWRQVVDNFWY